MVYKFMEEAFKTAELSAKEENVPVGAVLVRGNEIIAKASNGQFPCEHAEIKAINKACEILNSKNLSDCEIYVTLEPCPMCAGAILLSGIKRVWFGAYDDKYGACVSRDNSFARYKELSKVEINGGIMEEECAGIIKNFFRKKRGKINENEKKETQRRKT